MAGALCATCCPPSLLPAAFPVASCKRAVKLSSSLAHPNGGMLRRESCRGSVAAQSSSRRTEVRCCCASASRSESSCSDSGHLDSHLATTRRQLLLLASGAAATAAALPSYADEVPALFPLFLFVSLLSSLLNSCAAYLARTSISFDRIS
jgi:hypothetical protein